MRIRWMRLVTRVRRARVWRRTTLAGYWIWTQGWGLDGETLTSLISDSSSWFLLLSSTRAALSRSLDPLVVSTLPPRRPHPQVRGSHTARPLCVCPCPWGL
ncbi:hypothetical protein C8R46DRAFT_1076219 [Mycena filopes]|nr:hypothetical protein C8R46DRAFT_1139559 [Mycena filopes]KAJ7178274.1 hypothetical protein C8R46DRAFT_1076219 [Mycena filopes]